MLFNSNAFGKFLAEINCKNTEKKLEYVCMIYLKDKKSKLKENKAQFTVTADMPSMPGAHIIKPVNSKNLAAPQVCAPFITTSILHILSIS